MNHSIENSKEKLITPYNILLVIAFCYDTLFNYATVVFRRLPIIGSVGDFVMPTVVIVLVLLNIFVYKTFAIHSYDLLITVVVVILLAISFLIYPENQQYYNVRNMRLVFLKAIPFLFIGTNFVAKKVTLRVLTYASYAAIIVNTAYLFYYMTDRDASDYNMNLAYLMLPHVLLAIHGLFNKNLKLNVVIRIALFVVGLVFIVSMGTRGPILIMLVYLIVVIWKNTFGYGWKRAIIPMILIGVGVYCLSDSYMSLLADLRDYIEDLGLSTRALDMFFEGEYISSTSGRDDIYDILWVKIFNKPLGYGIFGEWQFVNYSAHNIYLQVCMYFGLIIGTLVIALLLILVLKGYFSTKNTVARDFILLYLVFCVVRGIFGGEFFSDYVFFLIGLSLQCAIKKRSLDAEVCENA